jgi:hypothetical protein
LTIQNLCIIDNITYWMINRSDTVCFANIWGLHYDFPTPFFPTYPCYADREIRQNFGIPLTSEFDRVNHAQSLIDHYMLCSITFMIDTKNLVFWRIIHDHMIWYLSNKIFSRDQSTWSSFWSINFRSNHRSWIFWIHYDYVNATDIIEMIALIV